MRYCQRCDNWCHVQCLAGGLGADDIAWATDDARLLPLQVGPALAANQKARDWDVAVRHPIERKPRTEGHYVNQPFTMEYVLRYLRDTAHQARQDPNVQLDKVKSCAKAWIDRMYVDADARKYAKKGLKEIVGKEKAVVWYTCSFCGLWI